MSKAPFFCAGGGRSRPHQKGGTARLKKCHAARSPANPLADLLGATNEAKASHAWQASLWALWPTEAHWPGIMDIYEAAAFRRVHPDTIRRACLPDRAKAARLEHQRIGSAYRIRKASLQKLGLVPERSAA